MAEPTKDGAVPVKASPSKAPEYRVICTPAMISAGVDALLDRGHGDTHAEVVRRVWAAMATHHPRMERTIPEDEIIAARDAIMDAVDRNMFVTGYHAQVFATVALEAADRVRATRQKSA